MGKNKTCLHSKSVTAHEISNINVTRGEVARQLSAYIMLRDKPIIQIPGSGDLEYIEEPLDSEIYDEDFCPCCKPLQEEPETPKWSGLAADNTHVKITDQGYNILYYDKNGSITNLAGKYSPTAREYIRQGCVAPDDPNHASIDAYKNHYCSPDLENSEGDTTVSAYTRMNDEYYLAKVYYTNQNYPGAYDKLGRSMHYLEDINCPPHAALITNAASHNAHSNYETWVRTNWQWSYYATNSTGSIYSNMKTWKFSRIARHYATSAKDAKQCVYSFNNPSYPATTQTQQCLHNAQKAVAGLMFRYLNDTGRLN